MGAVSLTGAASDTFICMYKGLTGIVHLHLAGPGAASHAQVLKCASKTGCLMPLKVGQGNDNVRVHNGPANLCLLHVLSVNGNQGFIRSLEAVGNNNMTSCGKGIIAILISSVQVVQCILPSSHIKGIAVGQEYPAALGPD